MTRDSAVLWTRMPAAASLTASFDSLTAPTGRRDQHFYREFVGPLFEILDGGFGGVGKQAFRHVLQRQA